MILTDQDIIAMLKESNMDVVLPVVHRPVPTTTSYYDREMSHRHNLLIDKLKESEND